MMKLENVKRIVLTITPGWCTPFSEEEKLTVTAQGVSYGKRFMAGGEKFHTCWKYRIESEYYSQNFDSLIHHLEERLPNGLGMLVACDAPQFIITVYTESDKYIIDGWGNLDAPGYYNIAAAFMTLIPKGEEYPLAICLTSLESGMPEHVIKAVRIFEQMPDFEEACVSSLLRDAGYPYGNTRDEFETYDNFMELCARKGIRICFSRPYEIVGMPWVHSFYKC